MQSIYAYMRSFKIVKSLTKYAEGYSLTLRKNKRKTNRGRLMSPTLCPSTECPIFQWAYDTLLNKRFSKSHQTYDEPYYSTIVVRM
jgi:hypothetical protein